MSQFRAKFTCDVVSKKFTKANGAHMDPIIRQTFYVPHNYADAKDG